MIGSIRGVVIDRDLRRDATAHVLVDVNGIGYELVVSARHYRDLAHGGDVASFSVHTHMREGAIVLYGFPEREERALFETLLATHGVGPSLALAILSSLPPTELVAAIMAHDVRALTAVPGVGAKTAQRLILELAERLDGLTVNVAPSVDDRSVRVEASEALEALGYGAEEIRAVMRELDAHITVDDLLRAALAQLAPRR